ncbi:hypothetical protein C8R43DRAFT_1125776 [Mycena crocata]|nr:hypothetical protein C8R43DRAFT_1125776 [Mycena crocata]
MSVFTSRRRRRLKIDARRMAGSANILLADNEVLIDPSRRPEDEPIPVMVDCLSNDNRRVYSTVEDLDAPSPVKKHCLRAAAPTAHSPAPQVSHPPLVYKCYELFGMGSGSEDPFTIPDPIPPPNIKYLDRSLHTWHAKVDSFTSQLIRQHGRGDTDVDLCRGCNSYNGAPQFRCRDCHGGAMYCQTCIVARHQDNPLHRVYYWTDGHFVKTPLRSWDSRYSSVTHDSREAGTPDIQVLRAKWFPATHEIPHTCATMEVLDLFHQTVVEAKTSMYHFYAILEKLTNNYGHCLLLLQGGQVTVYDSMGVVGIKPGALAIVCPACPRPGVNLDDDWDDVSEEDMHLYTWYLALDTCFRLKRCLVSNELRDAPLASGSAYMLVDPPFREYLLSITDQKERFGRFANTKFWRGYATTGVAMGVCARHEFVQPNGVGDLQEESSTFANVDYVLSCIMGHLHPRLRELVSYDIACIWSKDLVRRCAEDLPPLQRLTLILKFLHFAIPKMHIHSHNVKCQNKFSLNLMKGSAQVDSEGIERPWWWIAGIAAATREMGLGSHHDLLDLLWSYWNWQKLIGLMALLRRRRDRGEPELEQQKEAFEAFLKEQVEHVPAWRKMVHYFEDDPTARNPYELTITGLTEAQARLRFTEEEAAEAARGAATWHDVTPSKFLVLGLDIEAEQ